MWATASGTYAQSVFPKKTILETDAGRVLHSVKFEVRASSLKHRDFVHHPSWRLSGQAAESPWGGHRPNPGVQEKPKLAGPLSRPPLALPFLLLSPLCEPDWSSGPAVQVLGFWREFQSLARCPGVPLDVTSEPGQVNLWSAWVDSCVSCKALSRPFCQTHTQQTLWTPVCYSHFGADSGKKQVWEPWSTDDLPRPGQVSSETPCSGENCRLCSGELRYSEIMLKFKVSKELGVKFALTWISLEQSIYFCLAAVGLQTKIPLYFYIIWLWKHQLWSSIQLLVWSTWNFN